jgi:hypothetical protein
MVQHRSVSHRSLRKSPREVKADFNTSDEYQALYRISKAVNEFCPTPVWRLRNSPAGYGPPPAGG